MKKSPGEQKNYQERVRVQTLRWAEGTPYHNSIDDECCPDFSCCHPQLFETSVAARWRLYHATHGQHS